MAFVLTPQTKREIDQASSDAIKNEFSKLSSNFSVNKWVKDTNTLRLDTIEAIKNNTFTSDDMAEYIAASTITHLHDAWVFFGRGISALLNGDTVSARHMAYYSELRSAMSILATEGIAIFKTKHYYIDSSAQYHPLSQQKGTHEMLWAAVEYWSTLDKARMVLLNSIKPLGITLNDWLLSGGINALIHLSSDIYKRIGIDLQNLANDHNIRNRLSYRPSSIHVNNAFGTVENYKFVNEVWKKLEPGYKELDLAVLKQIIDVLTNSGNIEDKSLFVNQILQNTLFTEERKRELLNYLLASDTDTIISRAMNTNSTVEDAIGDANNHFDVFSRTLLLLRIATGANYELMQSASIDLDDFNFWWHDIFEKKSFIAEVDQELEQCSMQDLWNDINDIAIENVSHIMSASQINLHRVKEELSYSLLLFGETERAMLWGLSS